MEEYSTGFVTAFFRTVKYHIDFVALQSLFQSRVSLDNVKHFFVSESVSSSQFFVSESMSSSSFSLFQTGAVVFSCSLFDLVKIRIDFIHGI